jgi:hypothetical protein
METSDLRTIPKGSVNPADHYCPLCSCRKNGHPLVANDRDEGCTAYRCECHAGHEDDE